jgi:hypoxanthine phosphoribosyltransferase
MDRKTAKAQIGRILLTESVLAVRIANLAEQVRNAYADCNKVIVPVLLNGAKRFADELFERINDVKFQLRYLIVTSYSAAQSSGKVIIEGDIGDVAGQEVLITDDIYDSGLTISEVLKKVRQGKPRRIRTCLLLEKQTTHKKNVEIDFKAAVVPDCFVVGFGLDYNGQYRELPFIAELSLAAL